MSNSPPPCDQEVFDQGESLLIADTSNCRAWGFEPWVKAVASLSEQRVDWHYSGGIAQVLFIGDRDRVAQAVLSIPCPATIMRWMKPGESLYRHRSTT